MTGSHYNFHSTHFPKETLTKVLGRQPNYESLTKCYREIKKNEKSVPSNSGGGQHGHLGIVLDAAAYAFFSNDAFQIPAPPGELLFPAN